MKMIHQRGNRSDILDVVLADKRLDQSVKIVAKPQRYPASTNSVLGVVHPDLADQK